MRLKIRIMLCAAMVLLLMATPYSADGWIIQSVRQNMGINSGLHESTQMAGAPLDVSFIIQHAVQDMDKRDEDLSMYIIYHDGRIVDRSDIPDNIDEIIESISIKDRISGIPPCRSDFPSIKSLLEEKDNSSDEVLGITNNANLSIYIINLLEILITEGGFDYGDAPYNPEEKQPISDVARHLIVPGMHLGERVDAEDGENPSRKADGDDITGVDDEDGIVFSSCLIPGKKASIDVTSPQPGFLSGWMDFDGDSKWNGEGEKIFSDLLLDTGINHLSFDVSAKALQGYTYCRFRFSSQKGLSFDGQAIDGEIEDYRVEIVPANFSSPPCEG
jgi:hypothetical protein